MMQAILSANHSDRELRVSIDNIQISAFNNTANGVTFDVYSRNVDGTVAMILRSAMAQTLIGMAIGVPVAFYGVRLVKSQLYELTTVSSGALGLAVGTLLVAACLAGLIPARRAASTDPAQALRAE
jgi:predicted lysophospholipase L1 biosynthesis ABC-type transport system permease subunit